MKKYISFYASVLMLVSAVGFASCSDDDSNDITPTEQSTKVNDLDIFQSALTTMDENGALISRKYGVVLPSMSSDKDHVYLAVKDVQEAETLFRSWAANDEHMLDIDGKLVFLMTDSLGNPQGSANFDSINCQAPELACITFSDDCRIKHLSKISFLADTAWPENGFVSLYGKWDIVNVTHPETSWRRRTLPFVCIRTAKPGTPGLLMTVDPGFKNDFKKHAYYNTDDICWDFKTYPSEDEATFIQKMNNELASTEFRELYAEAGFRYEPGWDFWIQRHYFLYTSEATFDYFRPNESGTHSANWGDWSTSRQIYVLSFDDSKVWKTAEIAYKKYTTLNFQHSLK